MITAADRLAVVHRQIEAACAAAGRSPASVELLAVSKTHPAARIRELFALGQRRFGENYAQELCTKAEELADLRPQGLQFVFIGTLQSNKIKRLVAAADEIQTVAAFHHAEQIAHCATLAGKVPFPIYLSVNAAGEAQKSGAARADAPTLAARITAELPALALRGLMAIPPPLDQLTATAATALYNELATLAQTIGDARLSLGMSDDLAAAIAAGSTTVRIGTALFGPRT